MKALWNNDKVQFARLLCEIQANVVGTRRQWEAVREDMDLPQERINEVFDRALAVWEACKAKYT